MSTADHPSFSQRAANSVKRLPDQYWNIWTEVLGLIGSWAGLLIDVLTWVIRSAILRRTRFGIRALTVQMVRVGLKSIGIVLLVSACIGIILALQTAPSLAEFGQVDKVANLVGVAVFRELGPLIAAIVLTGFAGASIAAELGTMKVGEEIEALEAMALNPIRFLVMPRIIATTVSLVILTIFGDICSVVFGAVVGVFVLDIPLEVYKLNTLSQLTPVDFNTGLAKAAVFGSLVGLIACTNGLRVTGGAAGVGRATTNTVVQTIVAVVICDLMFSALFFSLGLN